MYTQGKYVTTYVSIALIFLAGSFIFFGYKYSNAGWRNGLDPVAKHALDDAGDVRTYESSVETLATLSGRKLHIQGDYLIDSRDQKYATFSTTSVTLQGDSTSSSFSLRNISIADDVYTKLDSTSPFILKTMLKTAGWNHYKKYVIPAEFSNVAIAGPVLDNLLIFSDSGKYVSFIKKIGIESMNGYNVNHYLFKLSDATPSAGGTLSSLINRIGPFGTIDAWIDTRSHTLRFIRFRNPDYISTTTIISMNTALSIDAPIK